MIYILAVAVIALLAASAYTKRHAISKIIVPRSWLSKDGFTKQQGERKRLYDAIYKTPPAEL